MGFMQTIHPGEFTFEDLDAMPDDGMQYELVDGMLLVTPAPFHMHQRAVVRFTTLLSGACPPDLEVLVAPFDFRPTQRRSVQPDVLVARQDDIGMKWIERPPLLAIEILSLSTRSKDLVLKRSVYEEASVQSYWIFEPENSTLTVLELIDGKYVEYAVVGGDEAFDATRPFPVPVVPSALIR